MEKVLTSKELEELNELKNRRSWFEQRYVKSGYTDKEVFEKIQGITRLISNIETGWLPTDKLDNFTYRSR